MPEPIDLHEPARRDLEGRIARALAYKSGITRDHFEKLPADPGSLRWRCELHAETAADSFLNWVCTRAPDAVAPLRAAGLLIWSYQDGFGPGHDVTPGSPATEGNTS